MMKARLKSQKQNQQIKPPSSGQAASTTFFDHVVELRARALWVGLFLVVFSALAYTYHDILLKVIMAPLRGEKLIYLTPGGGFSFIFLISMYAGLLATIPLFIYHLHAFIKPALPSRARRSAFKIITAASLLVSGGVMYGYFIAIPAALHFLTTFAGDAVTPSLTADSYLNFFLAYVAGLAFLSLLPLILMFVHWIKPLKPGGLLKSERWVILFAFVAAALITPTPDIVNQAMIAGPVIGIYQLGVVFVIIATVKENRYKKALLRKQNGIDPQSAKPATPAATPERASVSTQQPVFSMTTNQTASSSVQLRPVHTIRSVDGFRKSPSKIHVTPRSSTVPGQRTVAYPSRPSSIDGMLIRRTQMSQN